jgi:hypothetical protein
VQFKTFDEAEVEDLLRASDGRATMHKLNPNRPKLGHAGSSHFLLSNLELVAREEELTQKEISRRQNRRAEDPKWRPGGPMYIPTTAFTEMPTIIEMGTLLLRSPQAQAGLTEMFIGQYAEDGARLAVDFVAPREVDMRYVQGGAVVRVMPVRQLVMVVDRMDNASGRLHVQTFFGGIPLGAPRNAAKLYSANGTERLGFPGLL